MPPAAVFDTYRSALMSQTVAAAWRGHGSAVFLEFGRLAAGSKRDGSPRPAQGELTLMIEWSWRIEGADAILCGSWSDDALQDRILASLIGRRVEEATLHGRLPELSLALAGGLSIASFMTAEGEPAWTLFDRRSAGTSRWISVRDGQIFEDVEAMPSAGAETTPGVV